MTAVTSASGTLFVPTNNTPLVAQTSSNANAIVTLTQTTATDTSNTVQLSGLSVQLAHSEALLESRESTLTRSQLAAYAAATEDKLGGYNYVAYRAAHNNDVPKTEDPVLLARAKQAKLFDAQRSQGSGSSVKNPFASLSARQLDDVIYDDSGTYTVNERQAAYFESFDRASAWASAVVAQLNRENDATGHYTGDALIEVLNHYNALSPIRQASYPANYASDLKIQIQQYSSLGETSIGSDSSGIQTLIEGLTKTQST